MENRSRFPRTSKKVKGGLVSPKSPNCIVMPEKEGAEEKTTKDVVNKKQKQLMNKEEFVQEMPDDVKNIMMKGLRKGAGEFSRGGDPKNIIKKGVKNTIKNVVKSKSVQNFLNNEYIPEEGYDVARDQGKVKPSKDKKDATTMPVSDEVKKTQKKNKGPSALERVKADIEKRYGKGAIMDTKKEELDLTKVAESFGGFIVEKKEPTLDDLMKKQGVPRGGVDPNVQPSLMDMDKTPVGTKNTPVSNKPKRGRKTGSKNKPKSSFKQGELKFSSGAKGNFPSGSPEMGGESKKFASRNRLKDVPDDPRLRDIEGDSQTKKIKTDVEKSTGQKTREFTQRDKNVTRGNELKQSPIKKKGTRTVNLTGTKPKLTTTGGKTVALPPADPADMRKLKTIKRATRKAQKKIIKKVATKAATKGVAKAGGKFLAKRIPGIGAAISGAEAVGRAAAGDYGGAALAAGEGIASFVPGLGTAVSTGLGAIGAARDIRRATKAASTVRKVLKSTKGAKGAVAVKKAFQKTPKPQIKDLLKPKLKIPRGSTKTQTKRLKQIYGTKFPDRALRLGLGAGGLRTVGKKAFKTVRGAVPNLDQGHVGRRTAG